MSHEHGPHECYCPSCGYEEMVMENERCNTMTCPRCGDRMRATETGEYRISQTAEANLAPIAVVVLLGILVWISATRH